MALPEAWKVKAALAMGDKSFLDSLCLEACDRGIAGRKEDPPDEIQ